jgi:hypothetical protein
VPGSIAATNAPTQLSTAASADAVSSNEMQSFGTLFSSFSKQPFVGSMPPSNLPITLVTQSFAFGSATLPGVSESWWHLIKPVPFLDMHFVLPARHFVCTWAAAGAPCRSVSASPAVTIARIVMSPPCWAIDSPTNRADIGPRREVARPAPGRQGNSLRDAWSARDAVRPRASPRRRRRTPEW